MPDFGHGALGSAVATGHLRFKEESRESRVESRASSVTRCCCHNPLVVRERFPCNGLRPTRGKVTHEKLRGGLGSTPPPRQNRRRMEADGCCGAADAADAAGAAGGEGGGVYLGGTVP